jgi:hypothetical protein
MLVSKRKKSTSSSSLSQKFNKSIRRSRCCKALL